MLNPGIQKLPVEQGRKFYSPEGRRQQLRECIQEIVESILSARNELMQQINNSATANAATKLIVADLEVTHYPVKQPAIKNVVQHSLVHYRDSHYV